MNESENESENENENENESLNERENESENVSTTTNEKVRMKSNSVLITGAHGGLGTVVSRIFSERGWLVHTPSQAELNVVSSESVREYFASSIVEVDAVVHLVGGIKTANDVSMYSDVEMQSMIDLNFVSTFNVVRASFEVMKRSGKGSIITIGAQPSIHPVAGKALYAATKAAVIALTMSVAEEGKPLSIRANCVVPSIIRTDANLSWAQGGEEAAWVTPEEIAETICFLADPSCATSGATIPMYGKIPF